MRKVIKIILIVIGIIWAVIELLNLGGFVYYKEFKNGKVCDAPMPNCYVGNYSPWILDVVYGIFPNVNPNPSCKDCVYKPIIYLYPTQTQNIKVELDYKGKLIADYPAYNYFMKGWSITAYPDGKIINTDGKEYSYLFWEGKPSIPTNYDLSTGFVVKGEDTISFLQDTLSKIGLTPKEYNEFIVYWYPKMKDNKYNLIHFADKQYTDTAPLVVTPKPDSMLRVFMVFKPLDKEINIKSQEIKPFERRGFSVVEWGGTEFNK